MTGTGVVVDDYNQIQNDFKRTVSYKAVTKSVDGVGNEISTYASSSGWWHSGEPVGYWKMNETSGNASDSSIYGKNANNTNFEFIAGKLNNCASATTSTANFNIGNFDIYNLTGSFTVTFWVKIPALEHNYEILTRGSGGFPSNGEWHIIIHSSNRIRFYGADNTGDSTGLPFYSTGAISSNVWNRVVLTRDATTSTDSMKWYINGSLNSTLSFSNTRNFSGNGQSLRMGNFLYSDTLGLKIDDIQFWNGVVWSASDVTYDFNSDTGRELDVPLPTTIDLIFFREDCRYIFDKQGLLQVGDAYVMAPTSVGIKRYDQFTVDGFTYYIENIIRRYALGTAIFDYGVAFLVQ
jgi:hypothetical protein